MVLNTRTETEAYVIESKGAPAVLKTIPLAPLKDDEVEIDMKFCGLCHTDCHMQNNDWGITTYPLVAGHEGTGIVAAVGRNVTNLKAGDHVGVGWIRNSCKSCRQCIQGKENLCEHVYQGVFLGKNAGNWGRQGCELQGCFAKIMHIDARFAFKIPETVDLAKVAPLLCAGITVWEPIIDYITPGSKVGVVSLGGLGHMAVKLAKAVGAEVTVLSSTDGKHKQALDLGAHHYYNYSNKETLKDVKLDVIIDTCPVANNLELFLSLLHAGGTYVRVGIPSGATAKFEYNWIGLVFNGQKIVGSIVSGSKNTNKLIQVAANNNILSDVTEVPFSKINETMKGLLGGSLDTTKAFRYVLKWD
ncbi:hypothetical protein HDV04_001300 [Boothiomyces sp. JEL0838]|nr:hypothetical protein HDV04_001300 [Boothiomyces sp. JEL0838]